MMCFDDFQEDASKKWFGPKDPDSFEFLVIPTLGVTGEAGEVAEKMKKKLRGDGNISNEDIAKELGDVLFYVAILSHRLGYQLSEIAQLELDKINGRIERGTRKGSGDNR